MLVDKNELRTWVKILLKEFPVHKMSKETSERLNKIDLALFGDNNGNVGMIKKTEEIHAVLVGTRFTGKVILWFFGGLSVISGGIFALIKTLKWLAN